MRLFRAVPWILLLAIARILFKHYQDVDQDKRRQALDAIRRRKGRLDKLSAEERANLARIAKEVNHKKLIYDLGTVAAPFPTPNLFEDKSKKKKRFSRSK